MPDLYWITLADGVKKLTYRIIEDTSNNSLCLAHCLLDEQCMFYAEREDDDFPGVINCHLGNIFPESNILSQGQWVYHYIIKGKG